MTVEQHTQPTPHSEALYYASRGWRVVPVLPGQKRPSLNAWVDAATTDPDLIDQWWTAHPAHGVGIVTGATSGIFVLDVDPAHGGDDSLADLQHEHGPLPDTIEAITGGGGRHLIYQWPGWNVGTNAGQLGPGLDIRAEGGFIVAAPTIHPNGRPYQWELLGDPHDGLTPSPAPGWLLELLQTRTSTPPVVDRPPRANRRGDEHLPPWPELLTHAGATYAGTRTSHTTGHTYQLWTRPGKNPGEGTSATLNYSGLDNLKIFTPNWPPFHDGETVSQFRFYSLTHHDGDDSQVRAALQAAQERADLEWLDIPTEAALVAERAAEADEQIITEVALQRVTLIDWSTWWDLEDNEEQWVAEPIIAKGRGHALYAPAKAGKSTILLAIAAAAATGTPILGQPAAPPRRVLYCDYEMTDMDLRERLEELGYSRGSDLSNLHYALLPNLDPLDTPTGASQLIAVAKHVKAELVVIDTFGRAVHGDENEADTTRDFYRLTGRPLKAAGIAWLRTDHSGKDIDKGQRGSSAKNDDVDIVWKLSKTDAGALLVRTHSRIGWVPEKINIMRDADAAVHRYTISRDVKAWSPGTKLLAAELDALEVPLDWGKTKVRKTYRDALAAVSNQRLQDAITWRKLEPASEREDLLAVRPNLPGTGSTGPADQQNHDSRTAETDQETETETPRSDGADQVADQCGPPSRATADQGVPLREGTPGPSPTPNHPQLTAEDLI